MLVFLGPPSLLVYMLHCSSSHYSECSYVATYLLHIIINVECYSYLIQCIMHTIHIDIQCVAVLMHYGM